MSSDSLEGIRVNLLTKDNVEEGELKDRATLLLTKEMPIVTVVRRHAKDLGRNGDDDFERKLLERYIQRECIDRNVPWRIFLEGAYRPQNNSNLSYHSHYAAQLYRHYAQRSKLPLQTHWRIRYKVISVNDDRMQKIYGKIAVVQSQAFSDDYLSGKANDEKMKKTNGKIDAAQSKAFSSNYLSDEEQAVYNNLRAQKVKVITLPKKSVIGFSPKEEGLCFALSGCYDMAGAAGYMYFESRNRKERFYHEFNVDTEKTKLTSGNKLSPYASYPDRIISTKWCAKCLEAYYRPKLLGVKIDLDDNEEVEGADIEAAKDSRKDLLEGKVKKNELDVFGAEINTKPAYREW